MSNNHVYRADIDGLRAIAVLAVLLFHLAVPGFSGGFVGVDVFFVISGYLITGLVLGDLEQERFSLKTFYLRRVRRLAPALIAMLVPTTVGAYVLLYPEDMRSFATSLSLQFVSLQNFFFLADGEYFRGSDTKPLLHTWTLAVEEQFYLVWPILLVATRRLTLRARLGLLGALLVASFVLNLGLMAVSPKASFFLLPSRAWELGIGGLLSLLERRQLLQPWLSQGRRVALAAIGLCGILLPNFVFSSETTFPGFAVLLPVMGAACVVLAGIGGTNLLSTALSAPALVYVGKISYPMYLWHWPLIAFGHHLGRDAASPLNAIVIGLATLVLADLTYRFVESPVRERAWLATPKALLATAGVAALVLTAAGIHARQSEGAAYRFPASAREYLTAPFAAQGDRCGLVFRVLHPSTPVCAVHEEPQPKRKVLLWGNSHADMWSGLFSELGRKHQASVYLNARNCRPVKDSAFCGASVQRSVLEFISAQGITDVVLASTWHGSFDRPDEAFERELAEVVGKLSAARVHVWLMIDTPRNGAFDPIHAFRQAPEAPRAGTMPVAEYAPIKKKQEKLFASILASVPKGQVTVLDPSLAYCDTEVCRAGRGERPWYRDTHHLTEEGARAATGYVEPVFAGAALAY